MEDHRNWEILQKLAIAVEGEAEQAGGAATSINYLKHPMKELSGG